jgi:hypothetical protein
MIVLSLVMSGGFYWWIDVTAATEEVCNFLNLLYVYFKICGGWWLLFHKVLIIHVDWE